MHTRERPLRKSKEGSAITESYCHRCGMFIAASAKPQVLALAERVHRCRALSPKLLHDGCCEAQLVGHAFGMPPEHETGFRLLPELVLLMQKLARKQPALERWLRSSATNAELFRKAPFVALRAANLGIEDELLQELEAATRAIAQRLGASL